MGENGGKKNIIYIFPELGEFIKGNTIFYTRDGPDTATSGQA